MLKILAGHGRHSLLINRTYLRQLLLVQWSTQSGAQIEHERRSMHIIKLHDVCCEVDDALRDSRSTKDDCFASPTTLFIELDLLATSHFTTTP